MANGSLQSQAGILSHFRTTRKPGFALLGGLIELIFRKYSMKCFCLAPSS